MWVINLSLIFFNTSWGIYSIPKESKYTAVLLSLNDKTQCITVAPSFILDKLFPEKTPLNLDSYLK